MVMMAMTMDMPRITIAEEGTTRVEEEVMDIHHSKTTTEDPEVEERSRRIVAEGVLHKDHLQEEVDMTSEGWVDLVEVMGHPRGQAEELGLALKTMAAHLIQDVSMICLPFGYMLNVYSATNAKTYELTHIPSRRLGQSIPFISRPKRRPETGSEDG